MTNTKIRDEYSGDPDSNVEDQISEFDIKYESKEVLGRYVCVCVYVHHVLLS